MNPGMQTGDFSKELEGEGQSARMQEPDQSLLEALAGRDANRDRSVAQRTRRVVMSSVGVLKEQQHERSRARATALAITLVVLLLMAPMIWEAADSLIGGERLGDPVNQLSLWACIVCPTLLGAALIAGWWRRRS